jgi:AmmeMemoRadiSam system protein B
MILPRLRVDLDFAASPIKDRPGLLIRDTFRYSEHVLIIPPPLVNSLVCFDGEKSDADLQAELCRALSVSESDQSATSQIGEVAEQLIEALSQAGFLVDETYSRLKEAKHRAFSESHVREAAFAGAAYPAELRALEEQMREYLGSVQPGELDATEKNLIGIAAPHVSPAGGRLCYRAAYSALTPDLRERTFVVLGTSHYGQPDRFGLTRKPFKTSFGTTRTNESLVAELEIQPAALVEDYCHAVEHSIEFQVLFLQAIYGPEVRILPVLCGSFGRHSSEGEFPEDNAEVSGFLRALGEIAEREKERLFWVLGVDMAHMGVRYGDRFAARADCDEMRWVRERDEIRIARVLASDARGLWELVRENGEDDLKWCGSSAIYSFMKAVPRVQGTLRRYEQWNIDEQSVVSFGGISFVERVE